MSAFNADMLNYEVVHKTCALDENHVAVDENY